MPPAVEIEIEIEMDPTGGSTAGNRGRAAAAVSPPARANEHAKVWELLWRAPARPLPNGGRRLRQLRGFRTALMKACRASCYPPGGPGATPAVIRRGCTRVGCRRPTGIWLARPLIVVDEVTVGYIHPTGDFFPCVAMQALAGAGTTRAISPADGQIRVGSARVPTPPPAKESGGREI